MTTTVPILVVGAGPTGLTLGCELWRRGIAARVVDRVTGPDIRSTGKGLQPRSLEVLDDLGIAAAAIAAGRSHHRVRLDAGGRLAGRHGGVRPRTGGPGAGRARRDREPRRPGDRRRGTDPGRLRGRLRRRPGR